MAPTTALEYLRDAWNEVRDDDAHRSLFKRSGYIPPSNFSKGVIVIFSLIGSALVLASWWFFFYKGGFVWQEGDWDDYKSTVLRQKDVNGKTINGSTRAPETVVTEMTYQSEYYDDENRTEKHGNNSEDEGRKARKEKGKRRFAVGRWGKRRNQSPTSTERDRDQDLESYASEEPARMRAYNPHPVQSPSIIDEDEGDITNATGLGRFPSRYAYAYSAENNSQPARSTTGASEKSVAPLGPRRPTKKGSTRSKRVPSKSVKPPPTELSTIDDEGESARLSFEQEDDRAFTVYSGEGGDAPPTKGTKAYPYPVPNPTQKYPSRHNSSAPGPSTAQPKRKVRDVSGKSYNTASTSSGSEACDSDCSCCTTDSESESDGEYRQGDVGTKVYHHPIAALTPRPPPAVVVKKNSRGPKAGSAAKGSYRDVSRGTLSSVGSEGEGSVVETVTSRVRRALGRNVS